MIFLGIPPSDLPPIQNEAYEYKVSDTAFVKDVVADKPKVVIYPKKEGFRKNNRKNTRGRYTQYATYKSITKCIKHIG